MPLSALTDSGIPLPAPDVQRTTLSMDVMGRYVCNTLSEAVASGPFDVVVVGAGMFGGYCATRLAAAGKRVLVLDAGPFLLPTHTQNVPELRLFAPGPDTDTGGARELVWGIPWRSNVEWIGQAYCVGGKSLFWGGWCPRLLESDLAEWPAEVADYLRAHYGDVEKQTGVAETTDFVHGPLNDLLAARATAAVAAVPDLDAVEAAPLAVQGAPPAAGLFSFDKYSALPGLIAAARQPGSDAQRRLFVVPAAHVTRLRTAQGRVTHVDVVAPGFNDGLELGPSATVVLAAGTVESTRLALESFPTPLMGRNLMAHTRTNAVVGIPRATLDPDGALPATLETGALLVRGHSPNGVFHIQVTASADRGGNPDDLLFAMIPDTDQAEAMLAEQDSDTVALAFRGVAQHFGDSTTPVPNPEGRWIDLSPEIDEYKVRRAYVRMDLSSREKALAEDMNAAMRALASSLAGADVTLAPTFDGLGTTYHESGTLWMGTDPASSVTNPDGRFHHLANAYCADQALFATVGSVNPTLTGLVLARKVADALTT
jgi:choline dehydrogenase-like flavoprotein